MTRIRVALFNYENGGLRSGGGYDFQPLQAAFAEVAEPPALILFCLTDRRGSSVGSDQPVSRVVHVNDETGMRMRLRSSAVLRCRIRATVEAK
jgi:hypothetical protein